MEITLEQAFINIRNVCEVFKGTLKEHEALQISLQTIGNTLFPESKKSESKTK